MKEAIESNAESRKSLDHIYSTRESVYQKEIDRAESFEEKKYWNEQLKQVNHECEESHVRETISNHELIELGSTVLKTIVWGFAGSIVCVSGGKLIENLYFNRK